MLQKWAIPQQAANSVAKRQIPWHGVKIRMLRNAAGPAYCACTCEEDFYDMIR